MDLVAVPLVAEQSGQSGVARSSMRATCSTTTMGIPPTMACTSNLIAATVPDSMIPTAVSTSRSRARTSCVSLMLSTSVPRMRDLGYDAAPIGGQGSAGKQGRR